MADVIQLLKLLLDNKLIGTVCLLIFLSLFILGIIWGFMHHNAKPGTQISILVGKYTKNDQVSVRSQSLTLCFFVFFSLCILGVGWGLAHYYNHTKNVSLIEREMKIKINTTPPMTKVYINGQEQGKTPTRPLQLRLSSGENLIKLENKELKDNKIEVNILILQDK